MCREENSLLWDEAELTLCQMPRSVAAREPLSCFRRAPERVLRVLRLASETGLPIEGETLDAMTEEREKLYAISPDTVRRELDAAVVGKGFGKTLMRCIDLWGAVLPEVAALKGFDQHNPVHAYTILEHTARACDHVPPERNLRLAALFHDCGKPYCLTTDERGVGHCFGHPAISARLAAERLAALGYDAETVGDVMFLVANHMFDFRRFLADKRGYAETDITAFGVRQYARLFEIYRADIASLHEDMTEELAIVEDAYKWGETVARERGLLS